MAGARGVANVAFRPGRADVCDLDRAFDPRTASHGRIGQTARRSKRVSRPDPPEGYAWREDVEAVTKLLGDQTDAILRAFVPRVFARIEKEGLSLPLDE